MKKILPLCLILGTPFTHADVIKSSIHSVDQAKAEGSHIVKFSNGRVAFVPSADKSLAADLQEAADRGDLVEVKVNDEQTLLSVQTVEESVNLKQFSFVEETVNATFEPTQMTMDQAKAMFRRLNNNYVRASECSNRAHVWAHEEFTKNGIKSEKAFLFLTASYIDKHRFKWWFHVAPMVTVKGKGKYVMDYMFNHEPVTVDQWKNNFVFTGRACKMDGTFTEYDRSADQTQDCYMMYEPMYYWMPGDIGLREAQNTGKTDFLQSEVRAAYSEAF